MLFDVLNIQMFAKCSGEIFYFLRETIRFFLRVWRWAVSLNIRKIIKKNPNKSWARASSLIECSEVSFLQRIMYLPGCVVTELCTCRDMLLRNCLPAGTCCYGIVYLPGCVVTELCTCRDVLLLNCVPAGMCCAEFDTLFQSWLLGAEPPKFPAKIKLLLKILREKV